MQDAMKTQPICAIAMQRAAKKMKKVEKVDGSLRGDIGRCPQEREPKRKGQRENSQLVRVWTRTQTQEIIVGKGVRRDTKRKKKNPQSQSEEKQGAMLGGTTDP